MKNVSILLGFWLSCTVPAIAAMNENSIQGCRDTGGSKRGCTIKEFTILDTVCYTLEGKKECPDLDVDVKYDFVCKGHRMNVGIVAANGTTVALTYGGTNAHFSNVRAPLQLRDLDTRATSRATVNPSCRLTIKSVQHSPSFSTLEKWMERAEARTQALTAAIDAFRLASLYQDVVDVQAAEAQSLMELLVDMIDATLLNNEFPEGVEPFLVPGTRDFADFETMDAGLKEQWINATIFLPQLADYFTTWSSLKSIQDGLPSPVVEDDSVQNSESRTMIAISLFYKNRLLRSLTAAESFYAGMAAIRSSLKADMQKAVDQLNQLIAQGRSTLTKPRT